MVEALKDEEIFVKAGANVPKGILFTGPPGIGKTHLAKAVANESEASFFYKSATEFESTYIGQGAKNIRDFFKAVRKEAPAIVFIDEIDSLGGKRNKNHTSYQRQSLNQFLVELDGIKKEENMNRVLIIAATNLGDSLDPALTRAGRFDKILKMSAPDSFDREKLFQYYLKKVPF